MKAVLIHGRIALSNDWSWFAEHFDLAEARGFHVEQLFAGFANGQFQSGCVALALKAISQQLLEPIGSKGLATQVACPFRELASILLPPKLHE